MLIFGESGKFSVLIDHGFQNHVVSQPSASGLFDERDSFFDTFLVEPSGGPWPFVENIVPYKDISKQAGFLHNRGGTIPAGDVKDVRQRIFSKEWEVGD